MKITIKQIAEMAGVHRSTVDKVLHNREGVSEEVRKRIQKIIEEYDYKPNPIGQALKMQKKTIRIGIILLKVVNTACYGITIIATLLLGKVMDFTTKRNWCMLGALFIIGGSLILLISPKSIALVTFGGLLRGIGMTPILGMIFTMIADCIEYGQWKTGLRTAGAIQSAVTSGQKFGQGIGSALIGFIMEANTYNGNTAVQSTQALNTISNLFIFGIAVLGIIMIFILSFYHLDKEYPKVMKELLDREAKIELKNQK